MPGRTLDFQLEQNAIAIKNTLGWPTAAILGDNPTPGYLHMPGLGPGRQWVFPYTYSFCYPIEPPTQAPVTITMRDTPDGYPPAPAFTSQALISLCEDALPYSPGRSAFPAGQWTQIASAVMAAGGGVLTTKPVPPTTKTLAIHVEGAGTNIVVNTFQGLPSGTFYYNPVYPVGGKTVGWTMVPVNGQKDTQFVLVTTGGSGGVVSIYATDALVPNTSQGYAGASRAFPVYITNTDTTGGLSTPVAVVIAGSGAATPWLVPNLAPMFASRAVAGTTAVLPAAVGNNVWVFSGQFVVSVVAAGGAATLEDLAGNTLAQMRTDARGQQAFDLSGAPLGLGAGLQFTTIGAGTAGVVVTASQSA